MLKRLQFLKWPALIVGILLMLGACHHAPSRTAIETTKMRGVWLTDVATLGLSRLIGRGNNLFN